MSLTCVADVCSHDTPRVKEAVPQLPHTTSGTFSNESSITSSSSSTTTTWNVSILRHDDACLHNITVLNATNCTNTTAGPSKVFWDPTQGVVYVCNWTEWANTTLSTRNLTAAPPAVHARNSTGSSNSSANSDASGGAGWDMGGAHDLGGYLTLGELVNLCKYTEYESGRYTGSGLNAGRYTRPLVLQLNGQGFASFDTSLMLRAGSTAAEATSWKADTALSMRLPRGGDQQLAIVLTVTQMLATTSQALTYDLASPRLCKPPLHPPYSPVDLQNGRVTVLGKSYGTVDMSVVVSIGMTRCLQTSWRSDSSIQCRVSDGVGVGHGVRVEQRSHVGNVLETVEEARFTQAAITGSSLVMGGLSTITLRVRTNAQVRSFIADDNLPYMSHVSYHDIHESCLLS
jgi:hypothetical protein